MSVNSYLNNISSKLIITESERSVIDNHITALKNKLNAYFSSDKFIEHFAFGSYTRKTLMPRRADYKSDVDYMVVFKDNQYTTSTYLRWLRDFAEAKYTQSEIYQSHPTIVLELSRIKIELVPAIKNFWDSYKIPAPASNYSTWLTTSPNSFNSTLVKKNTSEKSLIRPLVRLMKYWNAQNGYVYSSFELEKLITDHSFYFCNNLWDYFRSFVSGLSIFNLSVVKSGKIKRLKEICSQAKKLEDDGYPISSELEIEKAIPAY